MGWYCNIPSASILDSWIRHKYNACFHGRHGVGKTTMVFDAFERMGWQLNREFLYFSAATIDPWVDLIGVPFRVKRADGTEVVELARPSNVNNLTTRAIFVDEFNRSHKKVRNALMELVQFKSINGLKFPNLEIIWAAVNPDEDADLKYDVEKLDPAQEDRFHIHVQIPYKPSETFFAERFKDPEMAEAVCKWWNDQLDPVKLQVTPRRLEYAIDVFQKTNDLRFVLPSGAHAASLKTAIESGNPEKKLLTMIEAGLDDEIRRWLAVENNLTATQNLICTNKAVAQKTLHLLSDERLTAFAAKHKAIQDQIKAEPRKYKQVVKDLAENSTQKILKDMCTKLLPQLEVADESLSSAKIEKKPITSLSIMKRRKAEILANYSATAKLVAMPPDTKALNEALSGLIAECAFATNTHQKEAIMKTLQKNITASMGKTEADFCLRVVEYIVSFSTEQGLPVIASTYHDTINSIVNAWAFHNVNDNHGMPALFEAAPFLAVNVLCPAADNLRGIDIVANDQVVMKTSNNEFPDIPEEPEYARGQSVTDLF